MFFSGLKQPCAVREIWSEARKSLELDGPLAGARIAAAAVEGDIETAAQVLDEMNRSDVEIDVGHVTSAIRACWGAQGSNHNAAKYLFQLLLSLELEPDIATFTCLFGAYAT